MMLLKGYHWQKNVSDKKQNTRQGFYALWKTWKSLKMKKKNFQAWKSPRKGKN